MLDALSLLAGAAFGSILWVAGWMHLRRSHRLQIDRLAALQKRQAGVGAERLADALRRAEVLKQEVLLLKKEIVQQQSRWDRHKARSALAGAAAAHRPVAVPARDERSDDGSGFANTQPWDPDSP